jgi:uncharacterized protein (TIGR03435 family)
MNPLWHNRPHELPMHWVILLAALLAPVVLGQPRPAFDAASVKALPAGVEWPPRAGYFILPRTDDPERFRARVQLSRVIEWAYGLRPFQVTGGPAWIREGRFRFAIEATAGHAATLDEMRLMVLTLLAERFHLETHRDTREVPVYALVTGRNGAKVASAEPSTVNGGNGAIDIGSGVLRARGATMAGFIEILTDNLDRPVVDKTGLTGHYDFTLNYDPSALVDWRLGPALFSLVQDLGLRLEQQKAPFEMLVIDSIERPSEN